MLPRPLLPLVPGRGGALLLPLGRPREPEPFGVAGLTSTRLPPSSCMLPAANTASALASSAKVTKLWNNRGQAGAQAVGGE